MPLSLGASKCECLHTITVRFDLEYHSSREERGYGGKNTRLLSPQPREKSRGLPPLESYGAMVSFICPPHPAGGGDKKVMYEEEKGPLLVEQSALCFARRAK